jgi:HK97 family phage prohead protease
MANTAQTRKVGPQSMRGALSPSSIDEKARTVEVTWTTGARVLRGYWDRFWEELSLDPKHVRMGRLQSGAPLLADHNGYRVADTLGVIESARLEKGQGVATIRFAKAEDDPEADKVFRKIKDGIIKFVSVGYRVHKIEKVEEGADKVPVMRATDWEPYEISVVAMPADAGATFRSSTPEEFNDCTLSTRGEPQEEHQVEKTEAQIAAEKAAEEKRALEVKAAAENAAKAERERASEIRKLSKRLDPSFAEKLINDGTPIEAARNAILEALVERDEKLPPTGQTHLRVEAGDDTRDKFLRGAEAWLVQRAGLSERISEAAKRGKVNKVESDPGEFRGMHLIDLAREGLERSGVSTRRMSPQRIAELAFRSTGYQTTSDFAVLLENVTNKSLLAAYATIPNTWDRFCKRGSVSDFRAHNRFRKGAFGTLDSLNEHGEFKNKVIPDGEKRSVSIGTKGNMIGISRRTLIDDDMGVFTDLATAFGESAANSIEADVYAALTANSGLGANYDANPLFHSSRNNINVTGAALSVDSLDKDRQVMASQADPSGLKKLNIRPAILLVPLSLGMLARTLNAAQYEPTANMLHKPNGVQNMFRDIIDTAQLGGTRRYLFADPAAAPVIEVTFLEGQESPFLESKDGWRVDGIEWKVRLDYGVNLVDFRGCVTNAGA